MEVRRLHWGCGRTPAPGWINSDRNPRSGVDLVCDIREGLPLPGDSVDYAFSMHALQEIPYADLVSALSELRRVLKPSGVLRLVLPDLDKGIEAYRKGDVGYFQIPDSDERTLGGKFVAHMLWYGHSRVLFTADFVQDLLVRAGFSRVVQCEYRQTSSGIPDLVQLDGRAAESLFVEAVK